MKTDNVAALRASAAYYDQSSCALEGLQPLLARTTDLAEYPLALRIGFHSHSTPGLAPASPVLGKRSI